MKGQCAHCLNYGKRGDRCSNHWVKAPKFGPVLIPQSAWKSRESGWNGRGRPPARLPGEIKRNSLGQCTHCGQLTRGSYHSHWWGGAKVEPVQVEPGREYQIRGRSSWFTPTPKGQRLSSDPRNPRRGQRASWGGSSSSGFGGGSHDMFGAYRPGGWHADSGFDGFPARQGGWHSSSGFTQHDPEFMAKWNS